VPGPRGQAQAARAHVPRVRVKLSTKVVNKSCQQNNWHSDDRADRHHDTDRSTLHYRESPKIVRRKINKPEKERRQDQKAKASIESGVKVKDMSSRRKISDDVTENRVR
jgi:hypothetical protein